MNLLQIEQLTSAVEACDGDVRSYSGRGMYGKECLAIRPPNYTGEFEFAMEIAKELMFQLSNDDAAEIMDELGSDARSDTLGMGTIIYFPHIPMAEDGSGAGSDGESESEAGDGE